MVQALKSQLIAIVCIVFILVNTVAVAHEFYWLNLVPVALLIGWALFAAADRLLLFVVLATPLSINLEELELGGIGVSLPTEPLMVALTLLLFLKVCLERRSVVDVRVWKHPITFAIALQLVWMAFCVISSSMPLVSAKYLAARLWFVCSMYLLSARLFEASAYRHRFFAHYLVGLCIVIIYALVRHASFGFAHDPAHWVMEPFFKDHTSYGAIIAFFLPFAITSITMPSYSMGERILASLMLLVLTLGMVFSYTRAAWVGVAGALALFVVMRLRVPAWVVGAIVVVGGALYLANEEQITIALERNRDESSDDLAEHVSSIGNISSDASNLERINRWHCALRMFEERPFTGWGPGTYVFQYAPFQAAEDRTIISTNFGTNGNAHSEYLGPLAEQGLPGLLFVIGIVAVTSWTAIRAWSRMPVGVDRRILGAAFFGLVTYYVHGSLNNFLDLDKASVPFWGFTALVVVMDLRYPPSPKKEVDAVPVAAA
jgi:putative inorganic carbon (hco3(-)) transporter